MVPNNSIAIAAVLEQEKDTAVITSISFSYNGQMGDIGATALAKGLPASVQEIGFVGCGIADTGGRETLNWMKTAGILQMICIEQNEFSEKLKKEFQGFKKSIRRY